MSKESSVMTISMKHAFRERLDTYCERNGLMYAEAFRRGIEALIEQERKKTWVGVDKG